MATEIPSDEYDAQLQAEEHSIEDALVQARAQLSALNDAASAAPTQVVEESEDEYTIHEIGGVGRYAVLNRTGWKPLLKVIRNPAANIDFSAISYPGFDGIIGEEFNSPWLLDPLHENFERYAHLRDNIAAVRNFLMQTYYVNTPAGMTPEKAQKSLEEIAAYVGKGFANNHNFLGLIPNHDPSKPYISISEASATGGQGAQYLYEKILEMHRQSSWMRPFAAVVSLFGGKTAPDWMLPPADQTSFTDWFEHDIAKRVLVEQGVSQEQIAAGFQQINNLEELRQRVSDLHQINDSAIAIDALANQLLNSAANMQNVAQLSEPVQRKAIDIAKDILRNLKVQFGELDVIAGLKLPPMDDNNIGVGLIQGVTMVYENLLAWGRGIDPSIMQHPTVLAGARAIGQMGYLLKREALRMAGLAGNTALAETISAQIARVPDAFSTMNDSNRSLAVMLDKVERGIDTMLSRLQTISGPGAKVGFSAGNELGSYMNAAPIAGVARQTTSVSTSRDTDAQAKQSALNITAQHNAARRQSANAHHQNVREGDAPPKTQARAMPGRQSTQAKAASRASSSSTAPTFKAPPASSAMTPAQLQAMRMNTHHHTTHEEELEHQHQLKLMLDNQRLLNTQKTAAKNAAKDVNKAAAAKAAMMKIDPHLLHGFQSAVNNTHGMTGPPVNPASKGPYSVGQYVDPEHKSTYLATVKNSKVPAQPQDINDPRNQPINDPNRNLPPNKGGYTR